MNSTNFAYAKGKKGFNTFIGGISGTINTPTLLADKLGISVARVENFTIAGADIRCKITGGQFGLPNALFNADSSITYFKVIDNLISSYEFTGNTRIFGECANFKLFHSDGTADFNATQAFRSVSDFRGLTIELPNCINIVTSAFYSSFVNTVERIYYIPKVTSLGATSGDDSVFNTDGNNFGLVGSKIYAHPSLATNNVGSPDGDLSFATSKGATVAYVSNSISPNEITDLTVGTITSSTIQLNFTPPSSTNAIDCYEVYVNGIFKQKITASGQSITGLASATNHYIMVFVRDIFYNLSLTSNSINATTL